MSEEPEGNEEPELTGALELRLDLPAVHSAARMARHLIRPFAKSGGIAGAELDNLILVAAELLGNAVDHGGGEAALTAAELDRSVRMVLVLGVQAGRWEIAVTDEGGGDPAVVDALIHPDGMPDLEDERGRGFFLIAQMVDEISVKRSESGDGLQLTAVRSSPA